jgi:hypothetical protein
MPFLVVKEFGRINVVDMRRTKALQLGPLGAILIGEKRDRASRLAIASSPANTVGQPLRGVGQFVIDDQTYTGNIQSASCHIRGHQHVRIATPKHVDGLVSGILRKVALQLADNMAQPVEIAGELLSAMLGSMKDNRLSLMSPEQVIQCVEFLLALDGEKTMFEVGLDVLVHADVSRIVQMFSDHCLDPFGHRRRGQHCLARSRREIDDSLDIVSEPLVEHLVGLVENEALNVSELDVASVGEIDNSTRASHDDLSPSSQSPKLVAVTDAAVDEGHRHRWFNPLDDRSDLNGQLPSRSHDECTRSTGL